MKYLVLLHAMAAVLGVGPVFFIHALFRKHRTVGQLKHTLGIANLLEYFPKIGGTLAVLTGITLVIVSDWRFADIWIASSIVLYILIQVVAVGIAAPLVRRLGKWSDETELGLEQPLPDEQHAIVAKANNLYWLTTVMGAALFILMFLKPM